METIVCENGLTLTLEERKGTDVVSVQIWVTVGSKFESPPVAGITHFIEHLIFKGTERMKVNEMASRIEALGGSINAYTSYDNTVYHIVVPKRAFREGFLLLADAVTNPAFPEAEIEKERKVVLEEIKMGEDDPQRKLFKELYSRSFQGHPYGRPVIGYEETVRTLTRHDIARYFRTHYRPGRMVAVVVGDIDPREVKVLAEGIAFKETDLPGPGPVTADSLCKPLKGSETLIRRKVRETYLALSFPTPSVTHKDVAALEVLEAILGRSESSRLQQELKNRKGLVGNIAAYLFAPKEEGLFIVYATFKGGDYGAVLKSVDDEIGRLLSEGPFPWEIEKAKNVIRASYVYGAETVQGRARQIGYDQTLTGDPRFSAAYLAEVDGVTGKEVQRVLGAYLGRKDKEVVVILPEEVPNPHSFRLSNGLRYSINVDRSSPSLGFTAGFVGGLAEEPSGKNGIFNILSRMLLKGTKDKDASAIAREIDLLAGEMSPFSGRNIFGLSGKFMAKDLGQALSLLRECLTASVMKDEELRKVKEEVFSAIRLRDDRPLSYTFRRFNETLFQSHPYSRDPVGDEAHIRTFEVKDLGETYKTYVTPANLVLAISGDIDEKEIHRLMESLFGAWEGPPVTLTMRPLPKAEERRAIFERDIRQIHMIFGFQGPGLTDKDRYAAEVLDATLSGMSGRIHNVLREEHSLAYATTFFNQMGYDGGAMGVYIGTDRKKTKEVERLVKREVGQIAAEGFTESEIERAKNYLIGTHFISMQSNGAKSTSMCIDTIYGLQPGFFKEWPKRIEKVTAEEVNGVAKKYLSLERMVTITVGPREPGE
jgi:zinc protease